MFFRIRFLDLVVRDVKIISKEHGGVAERPGDVGKEELLKSIMRLYGICAAEYALQE